jgi:hypothetical protein
MSAWSSMSRRGLFRLALPAFLLSRAVASSAAQACALDVDRIARGHATGVRRVYFRRYRVHTSVNLLSIPLFSRDDVGAACMMVEELVAETGSTTAIQFSGGSWPDRIKGYNRFGMTQEVVRREEGAVTESAYFSFLTSSPEKSADQAWRAFADPSRALHLAVARGAATRTSYASVLEHLAAPEGSTWMDCPRLMMLLRNPIASWQSAAAHERTERAYPTFLHAVRTMLGAGRNNPQCTFMHNAKLYDLHTILSAADGMKLLTGHITERGSRSESDFRVWFHPSDAAGLPSRIEFHPRSFLRLVFEQDATAGGPILHSLIPQENA